MRWVDLLSRGEARTVTPRAEATEAFQAQLGEAARGTVWASGCASWYLDADGVPEVWPWSPARHRELLREPELADFELA